MSILFGILLKILEIVIIPIVVVFLYNFITFIIFFRNLCTEIDDNMKKIQRNSVEMELEGMREKLNKRISDSTDQWVGFGKTIIIWIFTQKTDTTPVSYYRYLPSNDFRNFVQRGYYHYIREIAEQLTLFYFYCDQISTKTQDIESNEINHNSRFWNLSSNQQKVELEEKIENIRSKFGIYRPEIEEIYYKRGVQPFFDKNLFHIAKLYLFKTNHVGKRIMSLLNNKNLVIVWLIFAAITAVVIAFSPGITFSNPLGLIKDISTVCINISSFVLATVLAICTIIAATHPEKSIKDIPLHAAFVPVFAIAFGLVALSFSYFENTFEYAKYFFAITIELTIGNFLVLYLILNQQNLLKMLKEE